MRKTGLSLFAFFLLLTISACTKEERFEKAFFEIGYQEVDQALMDSKQHYKRDIALPIRIPPIAFTHSFGRFADLEGYEDDHLEITYLNQNNEENHYKIVIRPIEYKSLLGEDKIDKVFTLNDGNEALFSETALEGFNTLAFEKNGWQYVLMLDHNAAKHASELLLDIANSVRD
ncbi:hypothetical protein [Sporosarcina sp. HYO08]|uniref:hypothetical protein n=1 Tax=Sporosarcina sp. HYO08 TaxID=1759557 RepID=UPI0007935B8A|nr:hypothetical protein [Sporosarcina sp. HYO08]KXH87144.1 hypothetical protein AU377_00785 [Sporosarcina sp. HYO08]